MSVGERHCVRVFVKVDTTVQSVAGRQNRFKNLALRRVVGVQLNCGTVSPQISQFLFH